MNVLLHKQYMLSISRVSQCSQNTANIWFLKYLQTSESTTQASPCSWPALSPTEPALLSRIGWREEVAFFFFSHCGCAFCLPLFSVKLTSAVFLRPLCTLLIFFPFPFGITSLTHLYSLKQFQSQKPSTPLSGGWETELQWSRSKERKTTWEGEEGVGFSSAV